MIDLVATTSLRCVTRGLLPPVLQQRVRATEDAGTSKEKSYYVWIDVDGPAFSAVETNEEAAARMRIEQEARKGGGVRMRYGSTT